MKNRFSTIDIVAITTELQKYIGMRVSQVYDVDNKTYLFKLNRQEEKVTLLIESGIRIHTTEFLWPKNPAPSGFSMKLRKHLKNKRLERLSQLGIDRVIDIQFGSSEAAYHVILELYDRGNIVLTDWAYTILNILRTRTAESEDVKLVVRERYPVESARQAIGIINREELYNALNAAKVGTTLKKILMPRLPFGPAVLEHVLSQSKFPKNCSVGKNFNISSDINHLFLCLEEGQKFLTEASSAPLKGYIIQKTEKNSDALGSSIITNVEFHPFLFSQHESSTYAEYDSFDKAVDIFFSGMEGQKIDLKALQKEKEAMKKLENVKKDHDQRLQQLKKDQEQDVRKAQLIEMNLDLVNRAIFAMRDAVASQFSWSDIEEVLKEAQQSGDPVARSIQKLKLEINHITVLLSDPYDENNSDTVISGYTASAPVDIDLDLSAYANARKYYDLKRHLAKKEQKTIESSEKAYKSAERKTKLALKEVSVTMSITKARKVLWFEKFLWFISSENYLVIAGRDIQQNELIVKRYMKPGDVYVHADIHGASSVIIKNFQGGEIPPKTLNEAGTMAICYSTAWDAKIVTSAWWVYHHQVSKTAPTGEYLTAGSFMIRGKKNYLPPSYLVLGFGFLFKLDEDSLERHKEERNSKPDEDDSDVNPKPKGEDGQDETNDLSDDDGTSTENDDERRQMENVNSKNGSDDENVCHDDERGSSRTSSIEFPDTEVKFNLLEIEQSKDEANETEDGNTTMIIQIPRKVKKRTKEKKNVPREEANEVEPSKKEMKQGAPKRGQRKKLKKIKEKYRYQDEEERELRMKILASAGEPKEDKKKKKNREKPRHSAADGKQKIVHLAKPPEQGVPTPEVHQVLGNMAEKSYIPAVPDNVRTPVIQEHAASNDEIALDGETRSSDDVKVLCSLTGSSTLEDTLVRMKISASAGEPKEDKTKKNSNLKPCNRSAYCNQKIVHFAKPPEQEVSAPEAQVSSNMAEKSYTPAVPDDIRAPVIQEHAASDDEIEDLDEETHSSDDLKILCSLTGSPIPEDTLLFAVPVCAPYNAMQNYKYKIKVLPGTGKRGKASKTALQMFLQDRSGTSREKDLLRSVKDQDISRNFPGKVKLSAPNLKKLK